MYHRNFTQFLFTTYFLYFWLDFCFSVSLRYWKWRYHEICQSIHDHQLFIPQFSRKLRFYYNNIIFLFMLPYAFQSSSERNWCIVHIFVTSLIGESRQLRIVITQDLIQFKTLFLNDCWTFCVFRVIIKFIIVVMMQLFSFSKSGFVAQVFHVFGILNFLFLHFNSLCFWWNCFESWREILWDNQRSQISKY